jgi:hypothetical protein
MFCYSETDNEINKDNYANKKNHYMKDLKNYRSLTLTSNFRNQIENVVEVEEEKSPLNSWFRQQGASSTNNTNLYKAKTALPNLRRKLPKLINNDNKNAKDLRKSSTKSKVSSSNTENSFNSISLDTFDAEKDKRDADIRTPQPLNSFYLKCIEDVIKSNQPQKLVFKSEPTELLFVNSEPFFTYVTFGIFDKKHGRSADIRNIWTIDRKSIDSKALNVKINKFQ